MPYTMRNNMRTVEFYTITKDGTSIILSTDGVINSAAPFTGCSNTMQFSIEKSVQPPKKLTDMSNKLSSDRRKLIPTEQYKCSPFHQKTDLDKSGKYVKIGGTTLDNIVKDENTILTDENNTATGVFSDKFVNALGPAFGAFAIVIVGVYSLKWAFYTKD